MRRTRLTRIGLGALAAALTFAVVAPTSASGSIVDATGAIQIIPPPPAVTIDALQSDTTIFGFAEQQGAVLTAPLTVDAAVPGTYSLAAQINNKAKLPAGTHVDSHLFTSDPLTKQGGGNRVGTVTFDSEILGVIVARSPLANSDHLGASGTSYPGAFNYRELELKPASTGGDTFTISADRKTLSLDLRTDKFFDQVRVITGHVSALSTAIVGTPDPVTLGKDVLYTITVTNGGVSSENDVTVSGTLPPGTSLVTSEAPGGCTGSGTVTCALGDLAGGAAAEAKLVVRTPSTMPPTHTITMTASTQPIGPASSATVVTNLIPPEDATTSGFVLPGGSIDTGGDNPARVTLPNTGDGAPITITQGPSDQCGGPCIGPATTVSDFPGYDDPNNPIRLVLDYTFPNDLVGAAVAFASSNIYKDDFVNPPAIVPDCNDDPSWSAAEKAAAAERRMQRLGTQSGIASPSPCIDRRNITVDENIYTVTFEVLYLSGDPRFARR